MKAKHPSSSPHAQLKRAMNQAVRDRAAGVLRDPYQRPDRPQTKRPTTLGQLFARKYRAS